jgi:hypothetical protein
MIDSRFAILAAVITVAGNAVYARNTVRGRTQPNRVTWSMWTVAPLIAFAAEVTQHVGLDSILTLAVGLGPLLVVIASFLDPKAYARITPVDALCGALSVAALAAWAATGTGDVAILFSILSDFFGAVPTLRKAYRDPRTESATAFIASGVGAAITLLTIKPHHWAFASFGFPAYIVVAATAIAALVLIPRPARPAVSSSDGQHHS